ncbi:MAG: hypothetical protein ACYSUF_12405 [Planctomycetota bacterium]
MRAAALHTHGPHHRSRRRPRPLPGRGPSARRASARAGVRLRGPAPCPIGRIAGRHRQQIELLADHAQDLQQLLSTARSQGIIKPGHAVAVDVDPIALL